MVGGGGTRVVGGGVVVDGCVDVLEVLVDDSVDNSVVDVDNSVVEVSSDEVEVIAVSSVADRLEDPTR